MQTLAHQLFKEIKRRGITFSSDKNAALKQLNNVLEDMNITKAGFGDLAPQDNNVLTELMVLLQKNNMGFFGICPHYRLWRGREGWRHRCEVMKNATRCRGKTAQCKAQINVLITPPTPVEIVDAIMERMNNVDITLKSITYAEDHDWERVAKHRPNVWIVGQLPPLTPEVLWRHAWLILSTTASVRRFLQHSVFEKIKRHRIKVIRTATAHVQGVVEMTLHFLFTHLKKRPSVKVLPELRVLVIGYGVMGKGIVKALKSLNVGKVDVLDPYVQSSDVNVKGIKHLRGKYDVIVLSAQPRHPNQNHTILNEKVLKHLETGGAIINVSRETYIDVQAVKDTIRKHRATYFSDLGDEFMITGPYTHYTPHIASTSQFTKQQVITLATQYFVDSINKGVFHERVW